MRRRRAVLLIFEEIAVFIAVFIFGSEHFVGGFNSVVPTKPFRRRVDSRGASF